MPFRLKQLDACIHAKKGGDNTEKRQFLSKRILDLKVLFTYSRNYSFFMIHK